MHPFLLVWGEGLVEVSSVVGVDLVTMESEMRGFLISCVWLLVALS